MGAVLPRFTSEPDDPADARFFQRAQLIGVVLTIACCAFIAVYLVWTWSEPNRPAMAAGAAGCTVASLLLLALPAHILKGRWRDAVLLSWSGAIIVIVAVFISLDGGLDDSPMAAITFLPLIFATMAYPPVPMLTVAAAIVVTFVVMGIAEGDAPQSTFVLGCSLTAAAVMCATISRLHHRQRGELARVSRADPLTDCLNRRGFQERLEAELANATRHEHSTSLIVIDLDGFKAVNDRDGHAAGDALLVWTVQQITDSVRPLDAVGRLGGDEFAVVLPGAGRDEAVDVARRIEDALAPRTAASTGVATYPVDGATAAELHADADARLYAAKRGAEPTLKEPPAALGRPARP
jgi:diguanylate cyclase (GGDEF)-like protein